MLSGYVSFEKSGYLPTDLSNWYKKYDNHKHDYGIYLNQDSDIADEHIETFNYCSEKFLKEIYDKQGKPNYYTCRKYPNAPFIVFKKEKQKDLKVRA